MDKPIAVIKDDVGGGWMIALNPRLVVSGGVRRSRTPGQRVRTEYDSLWTGSGWSGVREDALIFDLEATAEEYRKFHVDEMES